ncbi:hypothetical protein HMPREF0973_00271 [Prevotella veroralis F0319]|uniref:Uncharacterized protein n=1 Tax=Prevotella veroralis F0319 TaxID=649761 RepID=C9MKZ6_9BACT|nr:hypothetical protein HMPREF0973_00271 [Prevotella veroralis F0319]
MSGQTRASVPTCSIISNRTNNPFTYQLVNLLTLPNNSFTYQLVLSSTLPNHNFEL